MAKKIKEKTNTDIAYEFQKYLKRMAIDFNFLETFYIEKQGDDVVLLSRIDEFFDLKAILKYPIPEFMNERGIKINLENEDFQIIKKSLKKDVLSISDESLKTTNVEYFFNNEKISLRFEELDGEEKKISAENLGTSLIYFEGNKKLLEVPKKNLFKYDFGDFGVLYIPINNICNACRVSYETEFAKIYLYFKSVR
jgi:hypothetical protein